ncbi:peptide transporter [Paraburkholderia azotifigens]|uniref:Peptide transporter n=1 Tax=Paraburkholderia azotifigens TaxID=2057004 RepID=A0A5C6VFY0_9BURK|nr:peptide transporter [Paraburkholderia azotifigens]
MNRESYRLVFSRMRGIRGGLPAKYAGFSCDLFAGTPIYKPSGFPTARVTAGVQATARF